MAEVRVCRECGVEKPLDTEHFYYNPRSTTAFRRMCKACHNKQVAERQRSPEWKAYARRWRHENPASVRETKIRQRYGISSADYEAMLERQSGGCAICGSTDPRNGSRASQWFCIDHDHSTGAVRGLLCFPCNSLLGHANDDPDQLRSAIAYLEVNSYACRG